MGYGAKPPGYWGGKKHLTWRQKEGTQHQELQRALDIWQQKVGDITFTSTASADVPVDFVCNCGDSQAGFSPSVKTLTLKRTSTLGTVLHEIGHLLGMSHEHDRPDSRQAWYEAHPGALGTADSIKGAVSRGAKLEAYGDYDNDSIMQYPSSKYEQMVEPSPGDVRTVKQINGW